MKKVQSFCFILLGVAIPTSIFMTNIIIGILSLLWIAEGGFSYKVKQIKSSKWMIAVISLVAYYGIAMLWGDNHNNSFWIFQRIMLLFVFIVFATTNFKQSTLKYGAFSFLVTTFISALVAIGINNEIIQPMHHFFSAIDHNQWRISAFIKYNYHNVLLSFSALLSFYIFTRNVTKYKWLYFLFIIVNGISIFTEAGRAGQLIFVFFFALYAIYYLKNKISYSIGIMVFLGVLLLGSYHYSKIFQFRLNGVTNVIQNDGQTRNKEGKIEDIRYVFVKESINYIKKQPIFGYGTGSFGTIFDREVKSGHNYDTHTTPHNNYLYVWFELGILGLILMLSIFYYQIKELLPLKNGIHRIILPLIFMILMLIDSYFFIFILTSFYIYFYTIYSKYQDR